ncbi:putative Zinc finger C-x8-C-x5-C-x3-H type [Trichostrongylus colubriformis]|uniref:Zinc finger C-x8-C-x5-C-x3-H type n=1 Tax=Trichostrongylus colubriformis TaxID=6319 RepID=A0AAN8G162_TRICO
MLISEELSLDLAPIEEHQKPLSELFSGNMSSVSSPMRIPGVDSFHTSPLTSFGEMLFGPSKSLLTTPSQISAFDNQEGPDMSDELAKTKIELRSHHEKVAIWEEGLKQARQACEAWKADAEHYKMKAEQAEMERNRAMFERDQLQLMQQLEAVKMHLASSGLSLGGLVTPQLAPPSEFGEGVLRAALQNSQPHNMFVLDDAIAPACARCGRDRSRADSRPGCPLCST